MLTISPLKLLSGPFDSVTLNRGSIRRTIVHKLQDRDCAAARHLACLARVAAEVTGAAEAEGRKAKAARTAAISAASAASSHASARRG